LKQESSSSRCTGRRLVVPEEENFIYTMKSKVPKML
jgi:hypothetical protein